MKECLQELHYLQKSTVLMSWKGFHFKGGDAESYLQGQLTNNIKKLKNNSFQITSRLDRGGRLVGFGILLKISGDFIFVCPESFCENLVEDLNKYIIMEDLEILNCPEWDSPSLYLNQKAEVFGDIGGLEFSIGKNKGSIDEDKSLYNYLAIMGFPLVDINIMVGGLVTDTILDDMAFDDSKGCYLGQEAVNKIKSNRGSSRYPVVITSDGSFSKNEELLLNGEIIGKILCPLNDNTIKAIASIKREYRIEGREYILFDKRKIKINYLPYYKDIRFVDKSNTLFESAIEYFHNDDEDEAEKIFRLSLQLNSRNEAVLESLGVLLGRQKKFTEGIQFMDELLKINENSVMAHTNKSLFLMNLGKIEEAEKEKALATVAGFKQFGSEAELKKKRAKEKELKIKDAERRAGIFTQILEMDDRDATALFGMAEVSMIMNKWEKSEKYLHSFLETDPENPKGNLLLAKTYGKIGKAEKINVEKLEIYASESAKKGDLKTANEIQLFLKNYGH